MILYLNTLDNKQIEVCLKQGEQILLCQKIAAERVQAEKLLLTVDAVLKKKKIKLKDIKAVEVKNRGGSFTSLRVGIAVANALGFALDVPVSGTDEGSLTHPVSRGASHPSQEGIFSK